MDLRGLSCFLAVVDQGGFSAAARHLGITQPSVSLQIGRLERVLGDQLFHRNGRRVQLTALGEAILPHARSAIRAIRDVEAAAEGMRGAISGTVTIGTIPGCGGVGLPELIALFGETFPQVATRLIESSADDLVHQVTNGAIDLAIVGTTAPSTHGLPSRILQVSLMVAVTHPDHPLASKRRVPLRELLRHNVMCTPMGSGIRGAVDAARKTEGLDMTVRYESGNPEMLVGFAALGLGVAIVPDDASLRSKRDVRVIEIIDPEVRGNLELVWNPASANSPAVRELIRLAEAL
jgi:DNA-binding transcriptional LysR family regulator